MKHLKTIAFLALLITLFACATKPIPDSTIAKVRQAATIAAEVGTSAAVIKNKKNAAFILAIQKQLDAQISTGAITEAQLTRIVVDKLPLGGDFGTYFEGVLVLWGITADFWVAPNIDVATMAAAEGLSAGITKGLKLAALTTRQRSIAPATAPAAPPKPTKSNVRKL